MSTTTSIRAHDTLVRTLIDTLRRADDLVASAVGIIARMGVRGGSETATGLPIETLLRMACRRTRWDATELAAAADLLRDMPRTAGAVAENLISWSQLRSIVRALRGVDAAGRASVDALVGRLGPQLMRDEPETLVSAVEDAIEQRRADLALAREDRAVEKSFLVLQPRLDGYGGSLYGEADAAGFATIASALDATADRAGSADDAAAPSRAQQRMAALVGICGATAKGGTAARPRLIAAVDVSTFAEMGLSEGARVLAAVAGRPLKLSPLSTDVLSCDADIVTVLFDGSEPIGVGNTSPTVPARVRTALIARDRGCRFPGCGAPVSWCDAHHIIPRPHGDASIRNLALFCRRCHRRIHRHRWQLTLEPGGAMTFTHRGRSYTTHGRSRPVARE